MYSGAVDLRVIEERPETLCEYGRVPIAFEVRSRLRVEPVRGGLCGLSLVEEEIDPYVKDYDAIEGEGPTRWPERFDLSRWGIFSAVEGERRVGGAVVAWNTPGVDLLRGRDDLAVLWDLRVHPEYRERGVGTLLFDHAVSWAQERGCRWLEVETQNINVPACRFYARRGCKLGALDAHAYEDMPDEAQLLWWMDL
jgi:ribosomal protein S18 acetylase RimI-like enzyme